MNLSPDLKRLAEIVYPGQQVLERDFGVVVRPKHGENNLPDMFQFKPSLTGEDWQKAQALDILSRLGDMAYHCKFDWDEAAELIAAAIINEDLEPVFSALLSGGGR